MLSGLEPRNIGPANMSGRFVDVAVVESDPYIYYAASATGGVFKTTNNGVTFEPVFEKEATHSVGDIAVHQKSPDIVWVGTGERANRQSSSWGDGVYKSTDGGETWTNMGLRETRHIGRIVLHPESTDVVYVAAMGHLWGNNEERGLYKSTDGGGTWRRTLYVDDMTGIVDVAMDPGDPEILYASAYQRQRKPFGFHGGGPGSGLYKSIDAGESWKELTAGLPDGDYGRIGISIYRKDPRIVYVCIEQGLRYTASTSYEERLAGIYRSEDRGESWTHMGDWNPRPMYASQILVDPNDDQRIYMEHAFSWSRRRRQDVYRAAPIGPLRRSPPVGQSRGLTPSHQSERRRGGDFVRSRRDVAVRELASSEPVLSRARRHGKTLQRLWRASRQRKLERAERNVSVGRNSERGLDASRRW